MHSGIDGECSRRDRKELSVKAFGVTVPKARDQDDAKFITCAATAGVRWLVSGDDDLLSLHRLQSVEIVSVTAFLHHLKIKPQSTARRGASWV